MDSLVKSYGDSAKLEEGKPRKPGARQTAQTATTTTTTSALCVLAPWAAWTAWTCRRLAWTVCTLYPLGPRPTIADDFVRTTSQGLGFFEIQPQAVVLRMSHLRAVIVLFFIPASLNGENLGLEFSQKTNLHSCLRTPLGYYAENPLSCRYYFVCDSIGRLYDGDCGPHGVYHHPSIACLRKGQTPCNR